MEMKKSHMWRSIVCLTALLAVMVLAPLSAADNGKRQDGQGKYARWTAEWWQWIYGLPVSDNPVFDETGAQADTAQPNPKAFYLVGVINDSNTASRSITIPPGTPLFGPVINFQNDNIAYDPPVTVPQLRADAAVTVDTAEYFLVLDDEPRPDLVARIKSPAFDYVFAGGRQHLPVLRNGHLRAYQAGRVGRLLVLHPTAATREAHAGLRRQLSRLGLLAGDRIRDHSGIPALGGRQGQHRRVLVVRLGR